MPTISTGNAMNTLNLTLSTELVSPELRDDFWRQVTSPLFCTSPWLEMNSVALSGRALVTAAIDFIILNYEFNAQRHDRTRYVISRSSLDGYMISIITSGNTFWESNENNFCAKTRDIVIWDLSQPFSIKTTSGSRVCITIPREGLGRTCGFRKLHGSIFMADDPVSSLIYEYVAGLLRFHEKFSNHNETSTFLLDALALLIRAATEGRDVALPCNPAVNHILRDRVMTYIDENLFDPNLDTSALMHKFNVSRAHLYRAMAEDGGIAEVIRNKRLDTAFMRIIKDRSVNILRMAIDCGFSDGKSFSRAFRYRFGLSPKDARQHKPVHVPDQRGISGLQMHFSKLARDFKICQANEELSSEMAG